ncbi:MAG: glycosyltransferase [Solirubrobacteraceae bacterium]
MTRAARTVLLVHSSAGGYGADRQLALIAGGLDPARYRPLVVLATDGPLVAELGRAGVETRVEPLAVLRRSELSPRGLAAIAGRLAATSGLGRGRDVAIVHSNTSVTLSGALAARRAGVPHLWHVREIYTERAWPAYRPLLRSADALACVSGAVRAQFPAADARARVLLDGLALPPGAAAPRATPAPGAPLVCLVLGRISSWKGQDILLRALAEVPGAVAVVAGDAWPGQEHHETALRRLTTELGVADRVRFAGFVADPHPLYAGADVVVVPSTRPDPLPNAALEAAAAGCCVVASRHGGLPEIVRDGETGLLVTPGDPLELAAALRRLAADRALGRRLGASAAADVNHRFAPGRLLAGVQALYDELLRDPARRRGAAAASGRR